MPIVAAQGEEKRRPYLEREMRVLVGVVGFVWAVLLGFLAVLPWLWWPLKSTHSPASGRTQTDGSQVASVSESHSCTF